MKNQYIEILDWKPVPSDLIPSAEYVRKNAKPFFGKKYKNIEISIEDYLKAEQTKSIGFHIQNKDLLNYLKKLLDFDFMPTYQIIMPDFLIHKDFGRKYAYNFVIDTGGDDVVNKWYDDNHNELFKYNIPPMTWHKLNTEINHNVVNITRERFAITITPLV